MKYEITTLNDAELILRREGAVNDDVVDGESLLLVCGFDTSPSSQSTVIKRQIEKHSLREGQDFTASMQQSTGGRPKTVYHFSINAANHVLLAAMTAEGKIARQEAINSKLKSQTQPAMTRMDDLKVMNDFLSLTLSAMPNLGNRSKQAFISAAMKEFAGFDAIPLPIIEKKYYTATEVGEQLGITANMVGRLANQHGIKTEQFGEYRLGKARGHDKQIEQFYYNDSGVARLKLLLVSRQAS
ncbi:antA/AntB antirepressor family protein [uncultured Endozoicomonas sp.]|uniref:antA/AntB antirepressor family protein n=1 Tax=uncultured Endozoicomonas sp. TaxID=432652 RepID=UPI002624F4DE|nr:antA/AntB antirepressor family protein [uncultured Endozoicomonas sp.]